MKCSKHTGIIYKITSPSGKSYIGQVVDYLTNGDKKGLKNRWRQHVNCSKTNPKKGSRLLNKAIIKYGESNLKIEKILRCHKDRLNFFEDLCICLHKTLVPNGYNLKTGGDKPKVSYKTRKLQSQSMKKKLENADMKEKWSRAKKGIPQKIRKKKNKMNNGLPKYIYKRYYNKGKYQGYCFEYDNKNGLRLYKSIMDSKLTMEEKLDKIIKIRDEFFRKNNIRLST